MYENMINALSELVARRIREGSVEETSAFGFGGFLPFFVKRCKSGNKGYSNEYQDAHASDFSAWCREKE